MKVLAPADRNIEPVSWTSVLSRFMVGSKPFTGRVKTGLFRKAPTVYADVVGHPGSPPGTEQN